jgi:CHAT domain-containing protein/tetratricopeptide (TPR) repeat protein
VFQTACDRVARSSLRVAVLIAAVGSVPDAAAIPQPACLSQECLESLLREASLLADRYQNDAAEALFQQALDKATSEGDLKAEAAGRRGLGLILYRKANYPAARGELARALGLSESAADRPGVALARRSLGNVAYHAGDREGARNAYRVALSEFEALGDLREQARTVYNLLFVPADAHEEDRLIQQGLMLARQSADTRVQGNLLHVWGDKLFVAGAFAAAGERYEQALRLLEQSQARLDVARVLTSLGRMNRAHGHPNRALECYRRALVIQEDVGDRQGAIQSINAIGVMYQSLGQPAKAVRQFELGLALAHQTGSPGMVAFLRGNLADAFIDINQPARGAEILDDLLGGDDRRDLHQHWHLMLSVALARMGQPSRAVEAADRAVVLAREARNVDLLPRALNQRARMRRAVGQIDDALADAHEALATIEQLRVKLVPLDFMKAGFGDHWQESFTLTIGMLQEQGLHREALEVAEQARARAFLDLLATREVETKPSHRAEVLALRDLQKQLEAGDLKADAAQENPVDPIAPKGGDSGRAFLRDRWRRADPELRSFVSATPVSATEIAATAARLHSTVLSYWVDEGSVLIWVVRADGDVGSARVAVTRERLQTLVRRTLAGMGRNRDRGQEPADATEDSDADEVEGGETWLPRVRGEELLSLGSAHVAACRELYQLLIQPVRPLLPSERGTLLTIVPHGPLFLLSFAALQDARGRYLVEDHALHYAPAGAVLQFTERKKQQASGRRPRFLLVADPTLLPTLDHQRPLSPLPGSRREVGAVAALLSPRSVTLLAGADAREETVRQSLGTATVIHFATHGLVRNDRPLDSFLALGRSAPDATRDGRLSVREIYSLELHADLVVLSACRTGVGKVSGDGIMGLTRAFVYAGTPSIVSSLWDVADEPAAFLLPEFYRSLQRHSDKSRALRTAQLSLLRALRAGQVTVATAGGRVALPEHPALWASFVLIGEP